MRYVKLILCGCCTLLAMLSWVSGYAAVPQDQSSKSPLAIEGYNYTNRYINYFSVNGQGGSNIYVSSLTNGGGGVACCLPYRRGAAMKTVHVRWQSGACYFSQQSTLSKQVFDTLHPFFKEQDVPVEVRASTNAEYMEVHFYPDGSISAAITSKLSPPRLFLGEHREDKSRYPRCPNDREPKN